MVEINWQAVFGILLIAAGGGWAGWQWWSGRRSEKSPEVAAKRSADEPPPPGAVEWVQDIVLAMGDASAESILQCLHDGATRDQARAARIDELEDAKANEVAA
jgi:hypothetical protein